MNTDTRLQLLTDWIKKDWPNATIEVASADASFRRYFRVSNIDAMENGTTYIAMDAPPEQEDCTPFIDVTTRLRNAAVHAPEIIKQDLEQGFLLLEDFGNTPYLDKLNDDTADQLYGDALKCLIKIQQANTDGLPEYDDALLLQEMQLMPEWFLSRHLDIAPTDEQQKIIDRTLHSITAVVLQQPQVFVHRDYHSRNLMITENDNPGVIDYQDAVLGPITYDLVSLLRDCYIKWPIEKVSKWALAFKKDAINTDLIHDVSDETFSQWFDYMGMQRHIKVLGIFARLNHRDGKANYLNDLPLTLEYFMNVANKYPMTRPLANLFTEWQIPEKIGTAKK
ncbi:phosphotransferase [Cocleimonas sp. KMM 6892]|uniref:aminoglycoside phosphotransferase family protein n=1 Tax=unclassified Cocleimonas TaxID=2639732 RepID=UPI002DB74A31|nr:MULTISPECIES: phosphotransferase [unclassified Cocleimonas]MEB8430822.1 phosphotransferase [Cocleimonas sp. KMM 6892]MEC4714406.1 phosphotransferase [Cocleimonas sp. KMM 6895]MEC4743737.1 phosphotransferase [Cocleimonas sp. KMM 6896]